MGTTRPMFEQDLSHAHTSDQHHCFQTMCNLAALSPQALPSDIVLLGPCGGAFQPLSLSLTGVCVCVCVCVFVCQCILGTAAGLMIDLCCRQGGP